jgi:hypothetical protein
MHAGVLDSESKGVHAYYTLSYILLRAAAAFLVAFDGAALESSLSTFLANLITWVPEKDTH